jgi:hypothetical protein
MSSEQKQLESVSRSTATQKKIEFEMALLGNLELLMSDMMIEYSALGDSEVSDEDKAVSYERLERAKKLYTTLVDYI